MPHITKRAPKVSTRSVYPYARESLRDKLQQDRQTDRYTDRQSDRQTDRQTDTYTDKHTDRQTDRQTHTHTLTHSLTDGLSNATFLDVLKVVPVHPKSGLISNSIFCSMPTLPLTWK